MRYGSTIRCAVFVLLAVAFATSALAQASITGVVKDSSGAVLPGVTVEASSPELIERVRTAISDEGGRYRIVDLRTGTYSVTFSLPGFTTVRREGVALTGSFTATVDADLRVGTLEETVTVTGESPMVDALRRSRQSVRSALRQNPAVRPHAHQRRLDIYNVTNAAPVLTYNQTFVLNQAVSTWLRPNSVLQARFVKFSAQVDF